MSCTHLSRLLPHGPGPCPSPAPLDPLAPVPHGLHARLAFFPWPVLPQLEDAEPWNGQHDHAHHS
jgi:hypothetical protein